MKLLVENDKILRELEFTFKEGVCRIVVNGRDVTNATKVVIKADARGEVSADVFIDFVIFGKDEYESFGWSLDKPIKLAFREKKK